MNIQSINNYNVSMQSKMPDSSGFKKFVQKLKQKALDCAPPKTFNDEGKISKWENIYSNLSQPAKNRIIMGASALLTQPAIDYYNHRVDKETRTVSRNRTIAKIVAGTFVGAIVRGLCHKGVLKMTDINSSWKYAKALIPENYLEKMKNNSGLLKNYQSAISTLSAIGIMATSTNMLLDAPITIFLTNKMNDSSKIKQEKKEAENA
ncbi:hypothetical protein IJ750_03800 [bacterium]|nr:hypothetical protein [bacterium]